MRQVAQQVVAFGMHELWGHLRCRPPLGHKPRSSKIICIPFDCRDLESVLGITIECETFSPPHINQPFCMQGFFPPGPRFICWTRRASAGYAECPWELSTMKSAWYSGPWAFSNAGIIFSFNLEQHFQFLCLYNWTTLPVWQKALQSSTYHNFFHIPIVYQLLSAIQKLSK